MRPKLPAWIVLGLGLLGAGCSLLVEGTQVVTSRVRQVFSDYQEMTRNRRWAEEAYFRYQSGHLGDPCSTDFAYGFKEGFSAYLYRGTCEPPYLVPRCYRKADYRTPEGYRAIEDWFAGFRAGVAAAQEGGYRYWITGPSPGPGQHEHGPIPLPPDGPPPDGRLIAPYPPPVRMEQARPAGSSDREELPRPRVAPKDKEPGSGQTAPTKEQPPVDDKAGNAGRDPERPLRTGDPVGR